MDKIDAAGNPASFLNPLAHGGIKPETKKSKGRTSASRGKGGAGFSGLLEGRLLSREPGTPELGSLELGPLRELSPSGEAVQELLDQVRGAGDALRERPFPAEILEYKRAVRNFLHYVVENGYALKQSQTITRKKKNLSSHVQVEVVDRKLEQLAAGLLSGQTTQLELLARLEEITGLLIDLVQ
jgi:uncharacterized protein YaaR (DUF327 family)